MKNKYIYIFVVLVTIFGVLIIFFYQIDKKSDLIFIENPKHLINSGSGIDSGTSLQLETTLDSISMETDFEGSIKIALEEFEKYEGKSLKNLIQLQRLYLDKQDYKESIKYGELGLKLSIENKIFEVDIGIYEELIIDLLKSLILNGNYEKANELIEKNKNLDLSYEKALLNYKKRNFDEAISYLIKSEDTLEILFLKARISEKKSDSKSAIIFYEKIIEITDNLPEYEINKKIIYSYISLLGLVKIDTNSKNITNYKKLLIDYEKIIKKGIVLNGKNVSNKLIENWINELINL